MEKAGREVGFAICILAGGYGTRLRWVWTGPKCLVPVAGKPVLRYLLDQINCLKESPARIIFSFGHLSYQAISWVRSQNDPYHFVFEIDDPPQGTTAAVLRATDSAFTSEDPVGFLMVLNGDTVFKFSLERLLDWYDQVRAPVAAVYYDKFAGAAIIDRRTVPFLHRCKDRDWDRVVEVCCIGYPVEEGFLDVGTLEGLLQAQKGKE